MFRCFAAWRTYSLGACWQVARSRLSAQKLSELWGQPAVVENRPGGNTIIGTHAVAKAPPDSYTG